MESLWSVIEEQKELIKNLTFEINILIKEKNIQKATNEIPMEVSKDTDEILQHDVQEQEDEESTWTMINKKNNKTKGNKTVSNGEIETIKDDGNSKPRSRYLGSVKNKDRLPPIFVTFDKIKVIRSWLSDIIQDNFEIKNLINNKMIIYVRSKEHFDLVLELLKKMTFIISLTLQKRME